MKQLAWPPLATAYPLIKYPSVTIQQGGVMRMKFTLNMENLEVNGRAIDTMVLDWIEEVSQEEVLEMSQQWISSQTFLTDRMTGLHKVGESSLTIEPVSE
jgi:hypothetical protein